MTTPFFISQTDTHGVKRYVTYNATRQKYFLTTNRKTARLFRHNDFKSIAEKLSQFSDLKPEYKADKPKLKRSALKGAK